MTTEEIAILSALIAVVVVSVWLGLRGVSFDYFPQAHLRLDR